MIQRVSEMWSKVLLLTLIAPAFSVTHTSAADIYHSKQEDGSIRYASQALDTSYVIFLKDEMTDAAENSSATKRSAGNAKKQALLEPFITKFSEKHGVDAALVRAVIGVESQFDPQVTSPKGARGAMQLMPNTAQRYGVSDRSDPAQNIEGGIRYLKELLALHKGNVALALASYNAGEGAVLKHGQRIPPYRETMLYVPAVMVRFRAGQHATSQ